MHRGAYSSYLLNKGQVECQLGKSNDGRLVCVSHDGSSFFFSLTLLYVLTKHYSIIYREKAFEMAFLVSTSFKFHALSCLNLSPAI